MTRPAVPWRSCAAFVVLGLVAVWVEGARAGSPYANPHLLIETAELAGLAGTPAVRIVDLRGDGGEAAYRAGHVPGAVFLDARQLDDPATNAEGLPIRPDAAALLFGRLGIDQDTTVVAYDDGVSPGAARLFFVLEFFGHQRVRVMNGGLTKWRREGRPFETGARTVDARRFVPRPRPELLATAQEVRASLGRAEVCLLDARSPAEHAGADVRAARGGHIPGSASVDWTRTLNPDRTFLDADRLRALFEGAGVRADREVIVYCQSGLRSAQDYLALRLLGHTRLRNYDGSWNEWGNDPTLPLAR